MIPVSSVFLKQVPTCGIYLRRKLRMSGRQKLWRYFATRRRSGLGLSPLHLAVWTRWFFPVVLVKTPQPFDLTYVKGWVFLELSLKKNETWQMHRLFQRIMGRLQSASFIR